MAINHFTTYNPDMTSYSQLEDVQNGTLAQLAYMDIISSETDATVREQKIRNLLKYCELDTQAMVEVVRFFADSTKQLATAAPSI